MANAPRDANRVPTVMGVSSVDLSTPTRIAVNPTTGAVLIDGASITTGFDSRYIQQSNLLGTANQIIVTNVAGTITLSTPQNIATTSSPTFSDLTLTGGNIFMSDYLSFEVTGGFGNTTLSINSVDTRVGIGIAFADSLFSVNQLTNATVGTGTTYGIGLYNSAVLNAALGADNSYVYLQSYASKPLQINNQGNNTYLNVGGGNVGIGTVTTSAKLQVAGSINAGVTSAQSTIKLSGGNAANQAPVYSYFRNGVAEWTSSINSLTGNFAISLNPSTYSDADLTSAAKLVLTNSGNITFGTVTAGIWNGTAIAVANGGTGQTTYTNGQLLIGNTTGNTLTKATLTGTANQIVVTNSTGSITLSLPQSIATTSTPTFGTLNLTSTSQPQLTVRYDASNYLNVSSSAAGYIIFDAVGTGPSFQMSDPLLVVGTLTVVGSGSLGGYNFSNSILNGAGTRSFLMTTSVSGSATSFVVHNDNFFDTTKALSLDLMIEFSSTMRVGVSGTGTAGTIGTAYNFSIANFAYNGTTITNSYGLYISTIEGTNRYGIFDASTSHWYMNGRIGLGTTIPTARLHLPAGTATANTAPVKFTPGVNLTALELGTMEFVDNGTTGHLYITMNVAGVLTRVQIV